MLMTPAEATRPVLIALAMTWGAMLAGCGAVENPQRFHAMAEHVAAINVPLDGKTTARPDTAAAAGLRPARFSPLQVSLMDPHDMWDARDAQSTSLRGAMAPFERVIVAPAEPVVEKPEIVHAVVRETAPPIATPLAAEPPVLRPVAVKAEGRTIQLGAFSSEAGARDAWARLRVRGELASLSPVFETVQVNGRTLTRLKVGPIPAETAVAVCHAVQVADAWCARQG